MKTHIVKMRGPYAAPMCGINPGRKTGPLLQIDVFKNEIRQGDRDKFHCVNCRSIAWASFTPAERAAIEKAQNVQA